MDLACFFFSIHFWNKEEEYLRQGEYGTVCGLFFVFVFVFQKAFLEYRVPEIRLPPFSYHFMKLAWQFLRFLQVRDQSPD